MKNYDLLHTFGLLSLKQPKEFRTLKNLICPILLSSYFRNILKFILPLIVFTVLFSSILSFFLSLSLSPLILVLSASYISIFLYILPFFFYLIHVNTSHQSSSDASGRQASLTPNFSFSLQLPRSSPSCFFQGSPFGMAAATLI